PASGHGGDRGRDKAFVGFHFSSDRDLDRASNAFAALDLNTNDPKTLAGRERRRLARGLHGCASARILPGLAVVGQAQTGRDLRGTGLFGLPFGIKFLVEVDRFRSELALLTALFKFIGGL